MDGLNIVLSESGYGTLKDQFQGISIERRSWGTNWPKIWRVKIIVSKNERYDYRQTEYFDSFEEIINWLNTVFGPSNILT